MEQRRQNAQVGVSCSAPGDVLVVNDSTFDTDATGVSLTNGATPSISSVRAQHCVTGVVTSGTAGVTLDFALVTGNGTGLELDGSATTTVKHGTVSNNTAGVSAAGTSVSIIDSLVTFNTTYGVTASGGFVKVSYSDVYGNGTNFVSTGNGSTGYSIGSFYCNPLYVSAPGNLRLTENSPARNASSTGDDLGALPYTSDPTPELVGTLRHDTTLTLADSPYVLQGDLEVPPGVTLTIEPGVVVEFAANQDFMGCGLASSQSELRVRGNLHAVGTNARPITFTSTGTGMAQWYGVLFLPGAAAPAFSHVNISEANSGIQIGGGEEGNQVDNSPPAVSLALDHVAITSTQFAMTFYTGNVVIDTTRVEDCFTGIQSIYSAEIYPPANVTLRNVVATGNATALIFQDTGKTVITSTTVDDNTYGLNTLGYDITVTNSIFTNNTIGIMGPQFPFSPVYSDVWGNGTDYSAATPGEGCVAVDPKYVSASNLHLQAGSACIDSGDASGSPPNHDYDGAIRPLDGDGIGGPAYDMGAYEYVPSPICGDAVALGSETCDDGYLNGTYGHCKSDCSGMGPYCGDGTTNGSEECDDGNALRGDGCTPDCKLEPPNGTGGGGGMTNAPGGGGGMTDTPGGAGDDGASGEAGASTLPAQGGLSGNGPAGHAGRGSGAEAGTSTTPADGGRVGHGQAGHAGRGSGADTGDAGQSDAQAGTDSNPEGGRISANGGSGGRGASTGGSAGRSAAGHSGTTGNSGTAGNDTRPPSGGGSDGSGCGCRVAERKGSTHASLYLLLSLALVWRKRRQAVS
jgi:cysteine-rich repeat protein